MCDAQDAESRAIEQASFLTNNIAYHGTHIVGSGIGIVVRIGERTTMSISIHPFIHPYMYLCSWLHVLFFFFFFFLSV
jgi:hypothetical protein